MLCLVKPNTSGPRNRSYPMSHVYFAPVFGLVPVQCLTYFDGSLSCLLNSWNSNSKVMFGYSYTMWIGWEWKKLWKILIYLGFKPTQSTPIHRLRAKWKALRWMSESKSPAGWRNAPALNPEMRRGLGVLLDRWNEREEFKNTQGFRVVRAAGA
jgi:hypothetical protein